jgi:hypothetical protein
MNLRDVGSETNVNDTVQTNKNDKYIYTCRVDGTYILV